MDGEQRRNRMVDLYLTTSDHLIQSLQMEIRVLRRSLGLLPTQTYELPNALRSKFEELGLPPDVLALLGTIRTMNVYLSSPPKLVPPPIDHHLKMKTPMEPCEKEILDARKRIRQTPLTPVALGPQRVPTRPQNPVNLLSPVPKTISGLNQTKQDTMPISQKAIEAEEDEELEQFAKKLRDEKPDGDDVLALELDPSEKEELAKDDEALLDSKRCVQCRKKNGHTLSCVLHPRRR